MTEKITYTYKVYPIKSRQYFYVIFRNGKPFEVYRDVFGSKNEAAMQGAAQVNRIKKQVQGS